MVGRGMPKAAARGGRREGLVRRQRVPVAERGEWIENREGFRRGVGIVIDGVGVVEKRQVRLVID